MPTTTQLKGTGGQLGNALISEQLQTNLTSFFNWGFLEIGGFTNVNINSSGAYGGNKSRLRPVNDPRYTNGRVWEGFQQDWVWENGLEYSTQPQHPSGVYVNGTFHPTSGLSNGHYINFPYGQVIFNSAIPQSSVVTTEYAYRWCRFVDADNSTFRTFMFDSLRNDDAQFTAVSSGNWVILGQNRLSMPCVGIEVSANSTWKPMQLGGGHYLNQDINFYVFAQNKYSRDKIVDILKYQNDKKIRLFDQNNAPFPLTASGSVAYNAMMYPDLVSNSGHYYKDAIFKNVTGREFNRIHRNLYSAIVSSKLEIQMPEV